MPRSRMRTALSILHTRGLKPEATAADRDLEPPPPPKRNGALWAPFLISCLGPRDSLHHPAHVGHAGAGTHGVLLRGLGDDRLGGEDVLRDRRSVLQCRARDHRRVADPALEQVLDLAGLDVQAEALLGAPHLLDDDGAFETRVVR